MYLSSLISSSTRLSSINYRTIFTICPIRMKQVLDAKWIFRLSTILIFWFQKQFMDFCSNLIPFEIFLALSKTNVRIFRVLLLIRLINFSTLKPKKVKFLSSFFFVFFFLFLSYINTSTNNFDLLMIPLDIKLYDRNKGFGLVWYYFQISCHLKHHPVDHMESPNATTYSHCYTWQWVQLFQNLSVQYIWLEDLLLSHLPVK